MLKRTEKPARNIKDFERKCKRASEKIENGVVANLMKGIQQKLYNEYQN